MKPKILIKVEGGIVSAVYTETNVDVEVIDGDIDGVEPEDIVKIKGEEFYFYKYQVNSIGHKIIDESFKAIQKKRNKGA